MRGYIRRSDGIPQITPAAKRVDGFDIEIGGKRLGLDARDVTEAQLRGFVIQSGDHAAAYLIRTHRHVIRKEGSVVFSICPEPGEWKPFPLWFKVAIEFLKKRPGWRVEEAGKVQLAALTVQAQRPVLYACAVHRVKKLSRAALKRKRKELRG